MLSQKVSWGRNCTDAIHTAGLLPRRCVLSISIWLRMGKQTRLDIASTTAVTAKVVVSDQPALFMHHSAARGPTNARAQAPPSINPDASEVRCGSNRCATLMDTGTIAANARPQPAAMTYPTTTLASGSRTMHGENTSGTRIIGHFS